MLGRLIDGDELARCSLDALGLWPNARLTRFGKMLDAVHHPQEFELGHIMGVAFFVEDIVKPRVSREVLQRADPVRPWQMRLGLAAHKAPAEHANPVLLRDWQYRLKCASGRTRHIFAAHDGAAINLKPFHAPGKILCAAIIVEGDDIRILDLRLLNRRQLVMVRPIADPDSACQWLSRI